MEPHAARLATVRAQRERMIMAKKPQTVFVCSECGYESPKWMGQCVCGAWNSMFEQKVVEEPLDDRRRRGSASGRGGLAGGVPGTWAGARAKAVPLASVDASPHKDRIDTGIEEFNRVLGGGLVPGSLTLISGEPGIGKSTIIMQVAANFAEHIGKVLYVSGEESEEQIKLRADRICPTMSDNLLVLAETSLDQVVTVVEEENPGFIIIDSIQTMFMADATSAPGSVSQVRACGNELMRIGKSLNIPVFIVAHVTKSGELAGPKIVEHLVDCVLSITGERNAELRILRSYKNRFGTTSEIGAFEMGETGLVEIADLSKRFLQGAEERTEGAMIGAAYEGTRPLLFEVQALAATTTLNFPRRTSIGFDYGRLNMILAVLERRVGLRLSDQDVYVNVVGGLRPEGTSVDLAVAMAVFSSVRGMVWAKERIAIGEIGLTGDLRPVQNAEKIVREAARMGFTEILLPASQAAACQKADLSSDVRLLGVRHLNDVFTK